MKKLHNSKLLLTLLVLFTISCNDNKLIETSQSTVKEEIMAEELTIQSAQQWFETKISQKSNGRVAIPKEPLWAYATQTKEKDGTSVVIAPVKVDEKNQSFGLVLKEADIEKQKKQLEEKDYRVDGLSTPQKLMMVKDTKGKVQTYLVKIMADYDYFENSLEKDKKAKTKNDANDFDGLVLFYDWNETKKVVGVRYENGKFKEKVGFKEEKSNGRTAGCSVYQYAEAVPCGGTAKISYDVTNCIVTTTVTTCFDSGIFDTSISVPSISFSGGGGGGASFDMISSSYRQNKVDNFLSQAAQYGVSFNPDERLDFIDNFGEFLAIKGDLLKAIQEFGNNGIQWIENKLQQLIKSIKQGERDILTNSGPFSSYKVNLFLYVFNAVKAGNIADYTMSSLGLNGSVGRGCGVCRGNAVKHAAWMIFNANTFGRSLAQSLGNAHEANEVGNQTIMDAHNNNIGLQVFDIFGPYEALPQLGNILNNGMPNNSANGFKFMIIENNTAPIFWTKDYPNEN